MRKNVLKFVLLSLFTISLLNLHAQRPDRKFFDVKNMLPTSPDAALLGRFGDIPIGYYTGTADISIPMFVIKEAGLEIPITLKYHGSGIKVSDESGWVGLGWSMEPAGSIIQVVNGKEDNLDHLVLNASDGYDFFKENMLLGDYSEKTTSTENRAIGLVMTGHGRPDYYYYNIPGYSGKFYINPETKEVVLMDKKSNIKILMPNSSDWTIITNEGHKFYFSIHEFSEGTIGEYSGHTYKLSKIELNNGKKIDFSYSDGFYQSYAYSESMHSDFPLGVGGGGLKTSTSTTTHHTKFLRRINAPNMEIEFVLEDRDDMVGIADDDGIPDNGSLSTKRLKSIVLRDVVDRKSIKSFDFNYSYFSYSQIGGSFINWPQNSLDKGGKRLKLNSIIENGFTKTALKVPGRPYVFSYNETVDLPLKTSFAKDFWGYYNAKNNTGALPDLSYYRYSGFPEYQNLPAEFLNAYGKGANRSVNRNSIQAGILTKIVYPTGGYSEFTYESNSFSNYNYPDLDQMTSSATRVNAEDKNNPNDTRSKQFTIQNSQTVKIINVVNRGPNLNLPFNSILPSSVYLVRIKEGGSDVRTIKTWQVQNSLEHIQSYQTSGMIRWEEDLFLEYVPNTYYVISTHLPDEIGPQNSSTQSASVSSQIDYFKEDNTTLKSSYGAGLRIHSIANFTAAGVLAGTKFITYTDDHLNTTGLLMSPLKHLYSKTMYFSVLVFSQVDGTKIGANHSTVNPWFISSESSVPFSDAAMGSPVGYSRVQERNYSGSEINGYHDYYYQNFQSKVKINNPSVPDLRNGLLDREVILTSTRDTVKLVQYQYLEKEANFFRGFNVFENFGGYDFANPQDIGFVYVWFPAGLRFSINSYPNNASWFLPEKKTTYDYFNGNKIKSTEDYSYNSIGQMSVFTSLNSKLKEVKNHYKYVIDDNSSDQAIQALKTQHVLNQLLADSVTVGGIETSKFKYNYSLSLGAGSRAVQSLIESSYGGSSYSTEVSFDKYDQYKNLRQFSKHGKTTTIIWSYDSSMPVAKIDNVSYIDIQNIVGLTALENFSALRKPTETDVKTFFDQLRIHSSLKSAHITLFGYDELNKLVSQTDAKGMLSTYVYDDFQRLMYIKDQNGSIVKSYEYYFKP